MATDQRLEQRQAAQTATRVTTSVTAFQGPIPPPETLERYSEIIPNGADRILAMAESQQRHRQELERAVVIGNTTAQSRAQIFAFILSAVAIIGGIVLIALDKPTEGLVSIIGTLVALAGVFIYGKYDQNRERQRKREELREAQAQQRLPLQPED